MPHVVDEHSSPLLAPYTGRLGETAGRGCGYGGRMEATAYWTVAPGRGELRREELGPTPAGHVRVRALVSGISRGTELLVHRHAVPAAVRERMSCPHQEGGLPGPVKYGYLSVGVVEDGAEEWLGRRVFCLYPHQDRYVVPTSAVTLVPDDVPSERAVLAGTVETALNALWDGPPLLGDRVAVVGCGMVGLAVAALLRRFPLQRLSLVDVDGSRAAVAGEMGLTLLAPREAEGDCDLVYHASASESGLSTALSLLGLEGEVIELSWYGDAEPRVPLGLDFHARRLSIRASQVGRVSPARAARRSHDDRLALALDLLRDPGFDALVAPAVAFGDLPSVLSEMAAGRGTPLCQVIAYPEEDPCSS